MSLDDTGMRTSQHTHPKILLALSRCIGKQALAKTQLFLTFNINHQPASPEMIQLIQRPSQRNLKSHQQPFPQYQAMLERSFLQVF